MAVSCWQKYFDDCMYGTLFGHDVPSSSLPSMVGHPFVLVIWRRGGGTSCWRGGVANRSVEGVRVVGEPWGDAVFRGLGFHSLHRCDPGITLSHPRFGSSSLLVGGSAPLFRFLLFFVFLCNFIEFYFLFVSFCVILYDFM